MEACFPPVVLDCVRTWCTNNNLMGSPGQYHGFCARSCAYCGPTGTPTFTPPTLVPSTMVPSTSQIPTALCNDGFLLRDAKKFLRRKLGLPELCVKYSQCAFLCGCHYKLLYTAHGLRQAAAGASRGMGSARQNLLTTASYLAIVHALADTAGSRLMISRNTTLSRSLYRTLQCLIKISDTTT